MLDLQILRDQPDAVRESQRARGEDPALVDRLLKLDRQRRTATTELDTARAEQKKLSTGLKNAAPEERGPLQQQARAAADRIKEMTAEHASLETELATTLRQLPNLIIAGVPAGGEADFRTITEAGERRDFAAAGFAPQDHLDLGRALGIIDMERGARVSGSRFPYLRGDGVRLENAIMRLCQDVAREEGFVPLSVPNLVNEPTMRGTGFLDSHAEEIYFLELDNLYLTGTSEVALVAYHSDEILDLTAGPLRYTATSTCYRREAGSHGKDTRGIFRTHQFQKTEMVVVCRQEDAEQEHERLLQVERRILDAVQVPYRVIDVAAGDLGSSAARKYDCEGWVPSQERYRELTSTSNCTTYQARRLRIRERDPHGSGNRPVATLNGTMATTRWIVAILENHQQPDGSVVLPGPLAERAGVEVLRPGAPG